MALLDPLPRNSELRIPNSELKNAQRNLRPYVGSERPKVFNRDTP